MPKALSRPARLAGFLRHVSFRVCMCAPFRRPWTQPHSPDKQIDQLSPKPSKLHVHELFRAYLQICPMRCSTTQSKAEWSSSRLKHLFIVAVDFVIETLVPSCHRSVPEEVDNQLMFCEQLHSTALTSIASTWLTIFFFFVFVSFLWSGWNCFKGSFGEISERRGGAHMGFSERINTILNWSELNWVFFVFVFSFFSFFFVSWLWTITIKLQFVCLFVFTFVFLRKLVMDNNHQTPSIGLWCPYSNHCHSWLGQRSPKTVS